MDALPSLQWSHTVWMTVFLTIASFLYLPQHTSSSVRRHPVGGRCALLTWVQCSVAYFISPNKNTFLSILSYFLPDRIFCFHLLPRQLARIFSLLETCPDTQGSVVCARLRPKVEDSLLFLPCIVQHPAGPQSGGTAPPGTGTPLLPRAPLSPYQAAAGRWSWSLLQDEARRFGKALCLVLVGTGCRSSKGTAPPQVLAAASPPWPLPSLGPHEA